MTRETVSIDLALQDGGAHGSFTWDALDELLQESRAKNRRDLRRLRTVVLGRVSDAARSAPFSAIRWMFMLASN